MTARVPIDGASLAWARHAFRLDVEEVAKAAGVKPEQVERFEGGKAEPTLSQLRAISKRLDRPVAFFLTPPPQDDDIPQTADFRGREQPSAELPSKLIKELRRVDEHREMFLDLVGPLPERLTLRPVRWDTVEKRAAQLRTVLGLREDFRPPESEAGAVLNFWRGLLEGHGVLVFQSTGQDLSEFRGLSLHYDIAPVILLNGADSPNGRTFTLFHELAHLANRTSGVCLLQETVQEEALCNRFAAEFLMPRRAVEKLLRGDTSAPIDLLARHFRVSRLAAAVRLKSLGHLTEEDLAEERAASDERWERQRQQQRQSSGFVPPWTLKARDLGPTYLGAVFEALESERLDYLQASYMLDARLPMIERMQAEFHRRPAR